MTEVQKQILKNEFSWVVLKDSYFTDALNQILDSKENLCICAPGGTGKSVLLKMAASMLPGSTVVLSTTGVSAANLAGEGVVTSTVHSFFRFPPVTVIENPTLCADLAPVMQSIDTILIDEVSMLNASNMDTLLKLLKRYRTFCEKKLPRLILFGDVLQLPPVVENKDQAVLQLFQRKYNGNTMFFNAEEFKDAAFKVLHLSHIYRQDDLEWKYILNRIRLGVQTQRDLDILNTRVVNEREFIKKHDTLMYLCGTNRKVQTLNAFYLDDDNGKTYYAETEGAFDIRNTNHQMEVTIAPGMQVMCTHNAKNGTYQNGTLGRVASVGRDSVYLYGKYGKTIEVVREAWDQYEYTYNKETDTIDHRIIGSFRQIGCVPAFAATIHKAQGLTLDSVLLDPTALSYMAPSLAYVALSRCTTMEGVGLTKPLRMCDIVTNKEGIRFLRDNNLFGRM